MATKRDLVEAHSFSRRRLVTAFVSGMPGGREVEPHRSGRTVVGGAALSVLLVAGAAIAGVLTGQPGDDWLEVGLVVSKDTGTAYVITEDGDDPVLRPVVNNTSAKLILGSGLDPTTVPQADIDEHTVGDDVGILGAPASLPAADRLVGSGWAACTTDDRGVRLSVAEVPGATPQPGTAYVVQVRGEPDYQLVAPAAQRFGEPQAFRFRLPDGAAARDRFLRALDLPESADAVQVPPEFVNLFPEGEPLVPASFGVAAPGTPVGYGGDNLRGHRVGDVVSVGDDSFLLTEEGPVTLDPFSAALALALRGAEPGGDEVASIGATVERTYPDEWPDGSLEEGTGELCARLETAEGAPPRVLVAGDPTADASAADVPADERRTSVEAGHGAFVLNGDFGRATGGSPFVVDAKGVRYELVGPEAVENLGYGDQSARTVPDSWLSLFGCGVGLSKETALRPPSTATAGTCR